MDETKASMEARSRPIDSAISFAFLVFRFSPAAAAFARGGTQLRWVSLHGPNSISCGLLIFFSPFFLFLFLSSYGIAREKRRRKGGKRRLRGNILWRVRARVQGVGANRIANFVPRLVHSFLAEQLRLSSFVRCSRNILTPDCVLTRTQGKSIGRGREEKKRNGRGRDRKMDEVSREKFERTPFGYYLGYNDALSRAEVGKSRLVDNAIVLMGRERQVKLPF